MTRSLPGSASLSLIYAAMFAAGGAWVPYVGLWLREMGFDGRAIGLLFAATAAARVVGGPLWSYLADRIDRAPLVLVISCLGCAALSGLSLATSSTAAISAGLVAAVFLRAPASALLDTLVVRILERTGRDARGYGGLRLWGSVGYLAAGLVCGVLAGAATVWPLVLAVALWTVSGLVATRLLGSGLDAGIGGAPVQLRRVMADPRLTALILSAVPYGIGMNAYDSYYALHLADLHLPPWWTGVGLAAGIGAETWVLAIAGRILARHPPERVIVAGMVAGVARLALTAGITDPLTLSAVQVLHGLAYGAWWIGAVELIRIQAPEKVRASVQAVFLTAGYGAGPLLCGALATWLLDSHGTPSLFAASAVLGVVATAIFLAAPGAGAAHDGRLPE